MFWFSFATKANSFAFVGKGFLFQVKRNHAVRSRLLSKSLLVYKKWPGSSSLPGYNAASFSLQIKTALWLLCFVYSAVLIK